MAVHGVVVFLSGCLTGAVLLYAGIRVGYRIVYQASENKPFGDMGVPVSQSGTWEDEDMGDEEQ